MAQITAAAAAEGLRAWAHGHLPTQGAIHLLIEHDYWLHAPGFRDAALNPYTAHDGTPGTILDWEAALTWARDNGVDQRALRLLELAASLAGHGTIALGDAVTGLDIHNATAVLEAIKTATGH